MCIRDSCYADDHREFQYFACDYLAAFQKILTFEDISQIRRYVRQKQWWDTIDCLDRIIGGIGLEDPRVDGVMLEWSLDEDFWVRRVAIDHQLCRKERTNTDVYKRQGGSPARLVGRIFFRNHHGAFSASRIPEKGDVYKRQS